jgi:hypothetical protein
MRIIYGTIFQPTLILIGHEQRRADVPQLDAARHDMAGRWENGCRPNRYHQVIYEAVARNAVT